MNKKVVVIGGGTAGWLTAAIIAAEFRTAEKSSVSVTLIESPEVPTIGVGEGTWPSMRATLQRIGLSENEFLTTCGASFKQGSKFVGWRDGRDAYYHPFMLPHGFLEANVYAAWRKLKHCSFADAVSIQARLCEEGKAPKQKSTPEYAGVLNYGYHLDAGKFVQLLQKHSVNVLKVNHVQDKVVQVTADEHDYLKEVATLNSGSMAGDLFIDCSGAAALLIGQHYEIPFLKKDQYLFNDTAIAVQVPLSSENSPIASPTVATAQDAGWIWDIGLQSRRGVGYVYSSNHQSDELAEARLKEYIAQSIGDSAQALEPRKIAIVAGHREKFWHKNCVAIGMAAGFIEPLEASALALVELSVNMICDEFPVDRSSMALVERRFNQRFLYRWGRIVDFLKLHYCLSKRQDSDYWRDAVSAGTIPDSLKELIELWRFRAPNSSDFEQCEEVFPAASYQYVLYGMGFETGSSMLNRASDNVDGGLKSIHENLAKVASYMNALPSNRELLDYINSLRRNAG